MQYTVLGFSQTKLLEYKLSIIDAHILRWFVDFYQTGKMVKIFEEDDSGRVYSWVKYDAVMKDLPLLGITNVRVIARRFESLCDCGLMKRLVKKTARGSYSCFSLEAEKYNELLSSTACTTIPSKDTEDQDSREQTGIDTTENSEIKEDTINIAPTVLKSTVGQEKNEEFKASVLLSTLAPLNKRENRPTVLNSTVATVPKSTVLLVDSSSNLNPSTKKPASASVLEKIQEIDPALIFDTDFYPAAGDLLNIQGLEEGYIEWLYNTLRKSPDIKNLRGYYYRVFCRDVYAKRYLAERDTQTAKEKGRPAAKDYSCPVCGSCFSLTHLEAKCNTCGAPVDPSDDEIKRFKALFDMDDKTKEAYFFDRIGIIKRGGNITVDLKAIDEKYGVTG